MTQMTGVYWIGLSHMFISLVASAANSLSFIIQKKSFTVSLSGFLFTSVCCGVGAMVSQQENKLKAETEAVCHFCTSIKQHHKSRFSFLLCWSRPSSGKQLLLRVFFFFPLREASLPILLIRRHPYLIVLQKLRQFLLVIRKFLEIFL